jgi:hypothetical protein
MPSQREEDRIRERRWEEERDRERAASHGGCTAPFSQREEEDRIIEHGKNFFAVA